MKSSSVYRLIIVLTLMMGIMTFHSTMRPDSLPSPAYAQTTNITITPTTLNVVEGSTAIFTVSTQATPTDQVFLTLITTPPMRTQYDRPF